MRSPAAFCLAGLISALVAALPPRAASSDCRTAECLPSLVSVSASAAGASPVVLGHPAQGSIADLSPDRKQVLFIRGDALFRAPVAGGREVKLATGTLEGAAWSPDARWIAYTLVGATETCGTGDELWIVAVAGGPPRKLSDCADDPSWRPDSKALAFRGNYDGVNRATISTVAVSGTARRDLVHWEGTTVPTLAWSPDRSLLAVTGGFRVEHTTILRAADGQVAASVPAATLPAWSPDSRRLALVRGSHGPLTLVVATRAGSVVRVVDRGGITFPVWSPDGRLAYVNATGSAGIFLTGVGGIGRHRLTREPSSFSYFGVFWSPDARRVDYLRCAN